MPFAWHQIDHALGLAREIGDVNAFQMGLRTVIIYGVSLILVRLGSKRFVSRASAFDIVVAIMLGSIMSRAINGSAPFVPTLVSGAVLIGIHWLLAGLAYRLEWLGPLVKGNPTLLVRNGQPDGDAMRRTGVSDADLEQALRLHGRRTDLSQVQLAYLERSGAISIIPAERAPAVLDVEVEDGVKTVRIRME